MRTLACILLLVLLTGPAHAAPVIDAGPPPDAQVDDGLTTSPSKEMPAAREVVDWVATIGGIAVALEVVVSLIVAATPSKRDDRWLACVLQRVSVLRALNIPNGILGRLSMPGTRPRPPGGV